MPSSRMLRRVALVRTDFSEECIASFMRVKRVRELRNLGFQRATRRHIPEDSILHSHRREHLKSYIALTG
jgi:hypothetical protein